MNDIVIRTQHDKNGGLLRSLDFALLMHLRSCSCGLSPNFDLVSHCVIHLFVPSILSGSREAADGGGEDAEGDLGAGGHGAHLRAAPLLPHEGRVQLHVLMFSCC